MTIYSENEWTLHLIPFSLQLLMGIWCEWVNVNQHFMMMQDLENEVSISILFWWLLDDYLIIISKHWTDKIYIYSSWRYDANGKTRISILWRCKIWKARLVFQLFKLIKSWQELMFLEFIFGIICHYCVSSLVTHFL